MPPNVSTRGRQRRPTSKAAVSRTANRFKPVKRNNLTAIPASTTHRGKGPAPRFSTPPPPKVRSKVVAVNPAMTQSKDEKLDQVMDQLKVLTSALASNIQTVHPPTSGSSNNVPTKKQEIEVNLSDSTDESSSDEDQSSELGSDVDHVQKSVWDRLGKRKYIKDRLGPRKVRKRDYDLLCDSDYLPPVKKSLLKLLFNESEYVKISDLLEENRVPSANKSKGHNTQVTTDAETGQLVIKAATKGNTVSSFAEFTECFTVLMAYRVIVNPLLALPMTNYLNVMAELAHPERGYPLDKWLAYDARLRTTAARQPKKLDLWSTVHSDIKQRTCLTSSSTSRDHGHKTWLHVAEGHDQHLRLNSISEYDICRRYNRGQCTKEPCTSDYIHACSICKEPGHTRSECDRHDAGQASTSRPNLRNN